MREDREEEQQRLAIALFLRFIKISRVKVVKGHDIEIRGPG